MEHPKDIGDISMLAVTLVLRTLGYGLYLPYGENTRCDLMLERDGFVDRVQCKTGRLWRRAWLRVDPPKNNQFDRVRFAADYEVGRVAIEGLRVSSGA